MLANPLLRQRAAPIPLPAWFMAPFAGSARDSEIATQ